MTIDRDLRSRRRAATPIRTAVAALAVLTLAPPLAAEPFVPWNDDQVLERVRPARAGADWDTLRALRADLDARPNDLEAAVRYARQAIGLARTLGDPRYAGYAQAALAPWWEAEAMPVEVLLLRATLRQNRHDFDAALADLERVLSRRPRSVDAWLERAVVLTVRGEPDAARASCRPLVRLADPRLTVACFALADGASGRARAAHDHLAAMLAGGATRGDPTVERFALGILADLAHRLGDPDTAEAHYRRALALGEADVPLLVQRSDFLLDRGRAAEVIPLLRGETGNDLLLLRLALAEKAVGAGGLARHVDPLRARFDSLRRRGERHHLGEESRFQLHLLRDEDTALELAVANWRQQREPADARRVLEAALAAGDRAAAAPVLDWRRATGCPDPVLDHLARALGTAP